MLVFMLLVYLLLCCFFLLDGSCNHTAMTFMMLQLVWLIFFISYFLSQSYYSIDYCLRLISYIFGWPALPCYAYDMHIWYWPSLFICSELSNLLHDLLWKPFRYALMSLFANWLFYDCQWWQILLLPTGCDEKNVFETLNNDLLKWH